MPELPEIETIMRGLKPHLEKNTVQELIVRRPQLRWPIPIDLRDCLRNQRILEVSRRAKYLLLKTATGTLIIHLGMSGRLQFVSTATPLKPHDHVDFVFENNKTLRYNDARRFGAILWCDSSPELHPLLQSLGPEPFDAHFTPHYLQQIALKRHIAIKPFIMDSQVVVGIGNIYAAEALFLANIHPATPVHQLTYPQWEKLVHTIQQTLQAAINQGGTTLKDFVNTEGNPGYFTQELMVYGRAGQSCKHCTGILQQITLGQRSTVFCETCQKQ